MHRDPNLFSASFSVLSLWDSGNWQRAVEAYFKMDDFQSEAMLDGQKAHEEWRAYTEKTKRRPLVFGNERLIDPHPEDKLKVRLHDWLMLKGVPDCYYMLPPHEQATEKHVTRYGIDEYKLSRRASNEFARTMQPKVYGAILRALGMVPEYARIYRQHPQKKQPDGTPRVDMSIVWLTDETTREALEWVETLASEMHNYLLQNDLYSQLNDLQQEQGRIDQRH